uniref:Uncharacterized protein n=1 Tax=Trichogramma kaykai TaxID=54128 RepID=A0ABD2W8L8_9HYME
MKRIGANSFKLTTDETISISGTRTETNTFLRRGEDEHRQGRRHDRRQDSIREEEENSESSENSRLRRSHSSSFTSRHTPSPPKTPLHVAATGTIDVDLINANSDKMNNEAHTRVVQVSDSTNATVSKTLSNPAPLEKKSELPSSSVVDNNIEVIEIDEVAKRVLGDDPTLPTKQKSPTDEFVFGRDMMVTVKKLAGDGKQTLILEETSYKKENNRFLNSNQPLTKPNFVSQVGQKYYKSTHFKKNVFNSKNSKPNSQNTFNQNRSQGQNRKR